MPLHFIALCYQKGKLRTRVEDGLPGTYLSPSPPTVPSLRLQEVVYVSTIPSPLGTAVEAGEGSEEKRKKGKGRKGWYGVWSSTRRVRGLVTSATWGASRGWTAYQAQNQKSETSRSRSLSLPVHVTRCRGRAGKKGDLTNGQGRRGTSPWAGDREARRCKSSK